MKKLLRAAAWTAAPKTMLTLRNPKKAAMFKAAEVAFDRVNPFHRKRRSTGKTVMKGLGAAAVALPVGLWVGRRLLEKE